MMFDELYQQAKGVLHPRRLSEVAEAGGVGAALLTDSGRVYTGVCIDTASSMGFCAEHAAAAAMVTAGENRVVRMVAVNWDGEILPPCGRCRGGSRVGQQGHGAAGSRLNNQQCACGGTPCLRGSGPV